MWLGPVLVVRPTFLKRVEGRLAGYWRVIVEFWEVRVKVVVVGMKEDQPTSTGYRIQTPLLLLNDKPLWCFSVSLTSAIRLPFRHTTPGVDSNAAQYFQHQPCLIIALLYHLHVPDPDRQSRNAYCTRRSHQCSTCSRRNAFYHAFSFHSVGTASLGNPHTRKPHTPHLISPMESLANRNPSSR